jgi:hypothetical protein
MTLATETSARDNVLNLEMPQPSPLMHGRKMPTAKPKIFAARQAMSSTT